MSDRKKVLQGLECCSQTTCIVCEKCPYGNECREIPHSGFTHLCLDALELLKAQGEAIVSLAMNKENAEQARETVKPTVDEFGDAHCICGETVGHIPNDKTLPKIRLNYCHSCGRKMVWE